MMERSSRFFISCLTSVGSAHGLVLEERQTRLMASCDTPYSLASARRLEVTLLSTT